MTYAFLPYRSPARRGRATLRTLARHLVLLAVLVAAVLAAGPQVEALDYQPFGDLLLFPDPRDGRLWQTDGTPEGTVRFRLLKVPCRLVVRIPGSEGDGALFRCADVLWFSGGTPGTTVQLTGPLGFGSDFVWWEQGRTLFFTTFRSDTGRTLWSSDLTPAGTAPIAEVSSSIHGAAGTPEALWWIADDLAPGTEGYPIHQVTIWRSDGTATNTVPAVTLDEDRSGFVFAASPLFPLGDRYVLGTYDVDFRQQVWSTDGTTGSALLLVGPERGGYFPGSGPGDTYVSDGSRVFFTHDEDWPGERQIWVTDGTVVGTRRVTDLTDVALLATTGFFGSPLLGAEDPVFFIGDDGVHGQELWVTDGTASGTHLFADLCPGSCSSHPRLNRLRPGGPWFLVAEDETGMRRPWWSDGTPAGTHLLANVCVENCADDWTADPVAVGDRVFFNAVDLDHGEELWVSEAGGPARRVTDFVPRRPFDSASGWFNSRAALGDRLVFDAFDHVHGTEPWVTDGTLAGTHLLVDLYPYDNAAGPPPPPPGTPEISGLRGATLRQISISLRAADGPADHFVLEIRSPTHGWRYGGVGDAYESADGWRGLVTTVPLTLGVPYTVRAKAVLNDGRESAYSEPVTFTYPMASESPTRCTPDAQTLCLGNGRFRVRVAWRNQHAAAGQAEHGQAGAVPIPGSDRSGHFWFFREDNVELVVKILDGSTVNGFHWTFYGALTDVEYWITVEDTAWGTSRTYYNPPGRVCGAGDTASLPHDGPTAPSPPASAASRLADTAPAPAEIPPVSRGLAFDAGSRAARAPAHPGEACVPDAETLCLLGGRFRVRVAWEDQHNGGNGLGKAMPYSDRTGFFAFFDQANVELVVKALDGTPVNGKMWVFYGALSDVGYTITVDDLADGHASRQYTNAPGNICGRADTAAF